MISIHIREFRFASDYDRALNLWQNMIKGIHVGVSDAPTEIQKKLGRDPDLFLVAEAGDDFVGTVLGGFDGRRGIIYHLAVRSDFQGQGVGSRLMHEVESRLRAKGCIRCYLLVTPDNVEAMHYYEQHGWQRMANVPYAKDLG
ncbi:MAG TPA: GNAT family N-acetyltransferase [Anaerolineales bacterium]